MTRDFTFIEDTESLEALCEQLRKKPAIAVDTEFVRERTFYPRAGLLQIADQSGIYLIDPLNVDLTSFLSLIENPMIQKVMHSVSEDLDVFVALGAYQPANIFDTQIAATWLGAGLSVSLKALVEKHTGIELDKSETRTDWLARPLSESQLQYAADDVRYLLQISTEQQHLIRSLSFTDYLYEDNKLAIQVLEGDHEWNYLNYSGAYRLNQSAINRFQRLVAWRERVARRDDKPKPHIIKDPDLLAIASDCQHPLDLKKIRLHPAFRRRYEKELNAVLFEQDQQDWPAVIRLQDIRGAREFLKRFKEAAAKLAADKGMPAEVMPSKRILEQIIKHLVVDWYPAPKQWCGWRERLLTPIVDGLFNDLPLNLER